MRPRAIAFLLVFAFVSVPLLIEAASDPAAAQTDEGDGGGSNADADAGEDAGGGEGDSPDEDEGAASETEEEAPDRGESEAVEEGPPWTYQMARISIALLALLGLAIAGAYYRFVVLRARGEF